VTGLRQKIKSIYKNKYIERGYKTNKTRHTRHRVKNLGGIEVREIKFRAWDKEKEEMFEPEYFIQDGKRSGESESAGYNEKSIHHLR
jgi:hypothetical protein